MSVSAPGTPEKSRGSGGQVHKTGWLAVSSKDPSQHEPSTLPGRPTSVEFEGFTPCGIQMQKGSIHGSVALGGIDLNTSGSVHVRLEKKLITLLFPDGRAFTLKTETNEELEEWKDALERALLAAPIAAVMASPDGIFQTEGLDGLSDFGSEHSGAWGGSRRPVRSLVVGRPILLALEDIDGSPSFLEKALRHVETYGVKVEGILRESADVSLVEKRVAEYEQGRVEFEEDENVHVVGDCIKHVLRELPSSPVASACCLALILCLGLEDGSAKLEALRMATRETFPEPNRRLLQRLLKMMRAVAAGQEQNRMSRSGVAACMAPLLLRPLLAGECNPGSEEEGSKEADEGAQIRAAARDATQAQAIVVLLMDNYVDIFPPEEYLTQSGLLSLRPFSAAALWHTMEVDDTEEEFAEEEEEDSQTDTPRSGAEGGGGGESAWGRSEADSDMDSQGEGLLAGGGGSPFRSSGLGRKVEEDGVGVGEGGGEVPDSVSATLKTLQAGGGGKEKKPRVGERRLKADVWRDSGERRLGEPNDDEAHLHVLELTRQDLKASLSREIRANGVLKDSLAAKKAALAEKRLELQKEVEAIREQVQTHRDAQVAAQERGGPGTEAVPDGQTQMALAEIGSVEKDVQSLKQELGLLQRQVAHYQRQHQQTTATAVTTSERREKIQGLFSLKGQLQVELERTMALCLAEQQKNTQLEEKRKREDPQSLQLSVAQQRASLAEAQAALQAEMSRGRELRRRMQAAQQAAAANGGGGQGGDGGLSEQGVGEIWPNRLGRVGSGFKEDGWGNVDQGTGGGEDGDNLGGLQGRRVKGWEGVGGLGGPEVPGGNVTSFAELSSQLEQFKEKRSQLMHQLSALSAEPLSPLSKSHTAGVGGGTAKE